MSDQPISLRPLRLADGELEPIVINNTAGSTWGGNRLQINDNVLWKGVW
jgi:hypothetical protein